MTTGRLLDFSVPQQTFEIGGVRVGGRPAARPTALIGSLFYHGHDVHRDEDAGTFDIAEGRVQAVRELLPRLQEAGIHKLLVDTCVLDLATMGQACSAMHAIKEEFGLPVGGGVHNAVAVWKGLKTKMGHQAEKPCAASALAMAVAVGADFLLYGPVEDAPYAFPAVAMVDTVLSQLIVERGESVAKSHPRYRIG